MTESAIDLRSGEVHFFAIIDFFLFDYLESVLFIAKNNLDFNVHLSFEIAYDFLC